jgi:chitinase
MSGQDIFVFLNCVSSVPCLCTSMMLTQIGEQGNVPDDPVLQPWQTLWELIGPVLPGETPIPQATLPPGTYPDWSGTAIYHAGDRVLFNGVPYQAKWWNTGQSPAAATSDPDNSPWVPLTQAQIDAILAQTKCATQCNK